MEKSNSFSNAGTTGILESDGKVKGMVLDGKMFNIENTEEILNFAKENPKVNYKMVAVFLEDPDRISKYLKPDKEIVLGR